MSEQVVDLRSTWATLRRRGGTLAAATVVGAAAGVGLLYLNPPLYSSTGIVLLPASAAPGSADSAQYDADTQVLIAESAEVLGRAGSKVAPPLSAARGGGPGRDHRPCRHRAALHGHGADRGRGRGPVVRPRRGSRRLPPGGVHVLEPGAAGGAAGPARDADREPAGRRGRDQDDLGPAGRRGPGLRRRPGRRGDALRADRPAGRHRARARRPQEAARGRRRDRRGPLAGCKRHPARRRRRSSRTCVTEPSPSSPAVPAVALLLTAVYLLLTNRRDLKLRSRDEIADAVGIPVVTSVRVRPASLARMDGGSCCAATHPTARRLGTAPAPPRPGSGRGRERPTGEGFVLVVLTRVG